MTSRNLLVALILAAWQAFALLPGASARDFVDAAGRKVDIPPNIARVMPAGPPAAVLLYVLAPERLTGWVRQPSDAEKQFLAVPLRDLPVSGRLTGKEGSADAETVRKVKPDLILDIGTVDAEYAELADRIQKQTGIPYILLDGSLAKTAETLRLLGKLLGKESEAEPLAGYAESIVGPLYTPSSGDAPAQKSSLYYGRGKDGLETLGADSINMEIFRAFGFDTLPGGSYGPYTMTPEQIIDSNPDVIVTLNADFGRTMLQDPAWAKVRAVHARRVFCSPTLPFGWVDSPPSVNRLLGAKWLRSMLDGQGADSLKPATRDFYRLFYHIDVTGDQLDKLLQGCSG